MLIFLPYGSDKKMNKNTRISWFLLGFVVLMFSRAASAQYSKIELSYDEIPLQVLAVVLPGARRESTPAAFSPSYRTCLLDRENFNVFV